MKESFALEESFAVFEKIVRAPGAGWKNDAASIHKLCDGHPFTISLIASLLRDFPDRWSYYINVLNNRQLQVCIAHQRQRRVKA